MTLISQAQITPDNTLGAENSEVNSIDELRDRIEGGAVRGDNLFHSFQEFNVGEGAIVNFANPEGIANIFSRVTGNNISEIFGSLGVEGSANLFLMNPNGIVFGENSAINVNGSFLGTTAENIEFDNGDRFSAASPNIPTLTIDFPIGLGFGSNSGEIKVQGSGHELRLADTSSISDAFNAPIIGSQEIQSGLNISSEKTLALIGNKVTLDGGILANPSGEIEISSIESGIVGINLSSQKLTFDYLRTTGFQDIVINNSSLISTSGFPGGNINIRGKDLSLSNKSLVLNSNFSGKPSGNINVDVSGSINLVGITSPSSFTNSSVVKPGIISQSFESGKGSDVNISANQLNISDFSLINTSAYSSGNAGDININVDDSITVIGVSPIEGIPALSGVSSIAAASGDGGNISLSGNRLFLREGATILSQALQEGNGGSIQANFSDSIELSGAFALDTSLNSFAQSVIGSTTVFAKGGNVKVSTSMLKLENGARVNATNSGTGKAGDIIVDANNYVQINGKVPDSTDDSLINYSQITASSEITNPSLRQLFDLPSFPEGDAGSVIINTPKLKIFDRGIVSVQSQGTGNAGNLEINADSISLDNGGEISASTVSGEGGNIIIGADNLSLFDQSNITTSAGGQGNGGNITIDSETLLGLENSDITANAIAGNGGNITIDSDYIFGLSSTTELTPFSDITASSELGIDGTVTIFSPESNIGEEVIIVGRDERVFKERDLVDDKCSSYGEQRVRVQDLGIPIAPSPFDFPYSEDLPSEQSPIANSSQVLDDEAIVQANTVKVLPDGRTFLVAETKSNHPVSGPQLCTRQ